MLEAFKFMAFLGELIFRGSSILVVDDFSRPENIFFVIFLMILYLHGLYLAAFFLGYTYVGSLPTSKKISRVWKLVVTFFIYQVAIYSILNFLGRFGENEWPYFYEIAMGVKTMTSVEFLFIFCLGGYITFLLKRIQKQEEDPYAISA